MKVFDLIVFDLIMKLKEDGQNEDQIENACDKKWEGNVIKEKGFVKAFLKFAKESPWAPDAPWEYGAAWNRE